MMLRRSPTVLRYSLAGTDEDNCFADFYSHVVTIDVAWGDVDSGTVQGIAITGTRVREIAVLCRWKLDQLWINIFDGKFAT